MAILYHTIISPHHLFPSHSSTENLGLVHKSKALAHHTPLINVSFGRTIASECVDMISMRRRRREELRTLMCPSTWVESNLIGKDS